MKNIEHVGAYIFTEWCDPVNSSGPNPYHPLCQLILDTPPEGYCYTENPQTVLIDGNALLAHENWNEYERFRQFLIELRQESIRWGVSDSEFESFIRSRDMTKQLKIPAGSLCYINTVPYYLAPNNWYIEIEDWVTLFAPYFGNGGVCETDGSLPLRMLKALFSMPNFKGVWTHVKQTVQSLVAIFGEEFRSKFHYIPLAINTQDLSKRKVPPDGRKTTFLFHGGSTKHSNMHFQYRGGLYLLEAFFRLYVDNPDINCELVVVYDSNGLRSVPDYYRAILDNHPKIRHVARFVTDEELQHEYLNSDVFVIPAYRLHSASTVQGLSYGLPVICSDGWGFDEYIEDGVNGLIAKGQHSSWVDDRGIMREQYDTNYDCHRFQPLVASLAEKMKMCVDSPELVQTLSKNALKTARELSVENRNSLLKVFLDNAYDD